MAVFLLMGGRSALATPLTVSVPADYPTIQAAINGVQSGSTIVIADGTYSGPGNVDLDTGGKSITLASLNGASRTIIDCGGSSSSYHRGFYIHHSETVSVRGLTLRNGYWGSFGGAVYLGLGASAALSGCILQQNTSSHGGAIANFGRMTLTNCVAFHNTALVNGGGLENEAAAIATLTNCTITGNSAGGGGGGLINYGAATLLNSIVYGNTGATPSSAELVADVLGSTTCTHSDLRGGYSGAGNLNADPKFASATDFHLQSGSPCLGAGAAGSAPTTDLGGTVRPAPPSIGAYEAVPPPTLQSIAVSPSSPSVAAGLTQQLTAIATYSDGTTVDVTSLMTWASSAPSVATVSSTGVITAAAPGTAIITGTGNGVASSPITLTVLAPVLQSVTVSLPSGPLAAGTTRQLSLVGHYSDGTTQIITGGVFSSDTPAVVTVSPSGLLTAVAGSGTATITATINGLSTSTMITAGPAVLLSVAVTPANPMVALGMTQQLAATSTYSDGTTQDVTSSAVWTSSAPSVAAVSSSGLVTAATLGTATIVGTVNGTASSPITLTVSSATLQSVTASLPSGPLAKGATRQMSLVGHYSDGTTQTITGAAFSSDAPGVVSVSANGLLTAVADSGAATITATVGAVSTTAVVTAASAALQSIAISPASVRAGDALTLTLTATYSDGTTQNVTAQATWTSSVPSVATVSSTGVASGIAVGSSQITAVLNGVSSSPVTLTVTSAVVAAGCQVLWARSDSKFSVWEAPPGAGFVPHDFDAIAGFNAQALAITTDAHAHVLLTAQDGSAIFYDAVLSTLIREHNTGTQSKYGPFSGWTAKTLAAGPDGLVRVLWTRTDGMLSLWKLHADGTYDHREFGPFAGWTARFLSVAPDNTLRVLWTTTSGLASLWVMKSTGSYAHSEYGPYAGWAATALTTGADGVNHLLWTHTADGQVSLWNLTDAGQMKFNNFGPYGSWTAGCMTVGSDGQVHLGWSEPTGTASLWDVPAASPSSFSSANYGPFSGWHIQGLAADPYH